MKRLLHPTSVPCLFITQAVLCYILAQAAVLRTLEESCHHTADRIPDEVFYHVELEPHHEITKRSVTFQPLRIHLHFDVSLNVLPFSHQQLIREQVQKAVKFWESTLKVRSTKVPIRLRKKCTLSSQIQFLGRTAYCRYGCMNTTVCGSITIPTEHLEGCKSYDPFFNEFKQEETTSPGVTNTDFILYVATIASEKCEQGKTIAYAAHCQQEEALDRPVAGYFSICPNSISTSRQHQQQLLSTIKHEILHALGFTAGLYAFYRDDAGVPLTPREVLTGLPMKLIDKLGMYQWSTAVALRVVRDQWVQRSGVTQKAVYMMVTPRVKAEVQAHFNCNTLEGAELEDQGIDGTVLTHWEKRVFENEAMTGTYTQNSVISRITLAMMEDTGWYQADYSKAGNYEWGKNLGCDFVKNSCYHWISTKIARGESIHPFCDKIKRGELWTDCTNNRHSLALCNLVQYDRPLPGRYQYFDHLPGVPESEIGMYGGSVKLADYCPYLQEFTWTDKNNITVRSSKCLVADNNLDRDKNFFAEHYGADSICLEHAGRWYLNYCKETQSPQHAGSGCYKYQCVEGLGLIIHIYNQSYRCYETNQVINVLFQHPTHLQRGTVVCPRCQEICQPMGVDCPPESRAPRQPSLSPNFSFCGTTQTHFHSVSSILRLVVLVFVQFFYSLWR